MPAPDFSTLSLPELHAWLAAVRGAIAVAHGLGGGGAKSRSWLIPKESLSSSPSFFNLL